MQSVHWPVITVKDETCEAESGNRGDRYKRENKRERERETEKLEEGLRLRK